MNLQPADITIAVTVYDRREFVMQAIESALNQTMPVRVIVVEDCGPDPGLREFVLGRFNSCIQYHRNDRRRGLFDNWNACLEYCRTPWLSILHDDDYLAPNFIAAMLELVKRETNCGLYFGDTTVVDASGLPLSEWAHPTLAMTTRRIGLEDMLYHTPFPFPGQLFSVALAQSLGGFRATSQYCGDWEFWAKMTAQFSAAQISDRVAFNRQHSDCGRGTNVVIRTGKLRPLTVVQHKRILYLLCRTDNNASFDRLKFQAISPLPTRFLLRYGNRLSRRLLDYHVRLLQISKPPNTGYRLFQFLARCLGGSAFVRLASRLWNGAHPGN
jgi:glycosyltransferase involved in cell wall biosynthesis